MLFGLRNIHFSDNIIKTQINNFDPQKTRNIFQINPQKKAEKPPAHFLSYFSQPTSPPKSTGIVKYHLPVADGKCTCRR